MPTRYKALTDEPIHCGEGVTRTSDTAAKLWPVDLTFGPDAQPLHTTIRALSIKQAEQFARNRHPHARTVVVGNKLK